MTRLDGVRELLTRDAKDMYPTSGSSNARSPLRRNLRWLSGVRFVTVTILLGSGVLVQLRTPGLWPVGPFFFLVALSYALAVTFVLTLTLVERRRWLIDVQLATDAVLISSVVLLTGGVSSYFSTLYALPIIGASILQFRRGGLLVGALSAFLYAGVVVGQYQGVFEFLETSWPAIGQLPRPPSTLAFYMAGLDIFGFLAVAVFSGYLAERLRTADASLARASTEIADLQAFNQHVIESMTSGLATTDRHGRVLTFNGAAESITDLRVPDVLGMRIFELLQLPPAFEASLDVEGEGNWRADLQFTTPGGRQIQLGLSAAPLITPGGRAGFLFLFQDVTETKRLQRQSAVQERLAAVGEMAAGIAHEIRNPLASMSGSIQILRQELPLNAEQTQLMDIVLRESERLNDTIKSFLAYARPQRISSRRFDLRQAVNDTALLLRHSPEMGKGHQIQVDVPGAPVWFEADEGQIRQVVWNLATNGLRAMPDGGVLVLGVQAEEAETVTLSVRDEGVGMPPDELDSMLQPFHGTFAQGTGLGLAIVHRIVSDYGGELQVTSVPDAGTTVCVRLPAPTAAPSPAGRPAARVQ
ncbi:MAG: PAS domain-containing protein [Acidobacteria bacterium]|nr:MAG: PAS domain-containing protein [Acidobacteriota bacterium]